MNEGEMIEELKKLENEVATEFENIRDYLYAKERSIIGLIHNRVYWLQFAQDAIGRELEKEKALRR